MLPNTNISLTTKISDLVPPKEEIGREFWSASNCWNILATDWFYKGFKDGVFPLYAKEGISSRQAIYHLHSILGSWHLDHSYKLASVAYLMSLWFVEPQKAAQVEKKPKKQKSKTEYCNAVRFSTNYQPLRSLKSQLSL